MGAAIVGGLFLARETRPTTNRRKEVAPRDTPFRLSRALGDALLHRPIRVLTRRSAIVTLMSIDIMLNSANINFVAFSPTPRRSIFRAGLRPARDRHGAAEVAVGLAILLVVYRVKGRMNVRLMKELKW